MRALPCGSSSRTVTVIFGTAAARVGAVAGVADVVLVGAAGHADVDDVRVGARAGSTGSEEAVEASVAE